MSVCAAAMSAAASSHAAGAAATALGSHARRLRDMLCVAEEEDEVRCLLARNIHA